MKNVRFKLKRNKYNASPTIVDDIRFPSKKEANRYKVLKLLRKEGKVHHFTRQVPYRLKGGTIYRLDFLVFWQNPNGFFDVTFEDTKGMRTAPYKIKLREIEATYGFEITEL